ncbi:MAG TPA: hypothetical protein VK609_03855 [Mucilaginibacter sp.]|nr:hypothetical protein [Mucilaginibacter sp.]
MKKITVILLLLLIANIWRAYGQQKETFDLGRMLTENKLVAGPANEVSILKDGDKQGISSKGIVWLKGLNFKQGQIDIDLRGKNVFLKSFLGIAFHGIDTTTCDILYFRPFNFRHEDTLRRKWSVAYMSLPDNNYAKLRKEHPLVYENAVNPVPQPDEWFHATLVLKNRRLSVYVNHSSTPSLEVTLINERTDGLFGIYADGLAEDFANLTINTEP